ncbi:alpha/beta fold hydrolase [Streptomyces purpurogeneiscleroticus]|uniref:alpha/beta fold hydrolase n=1 Tax=Streptomyces purpurogeneiscleroticus TaxID=68259 RepID=UPI001CBC2F17|nr:alpha/beta hydrolase [Streptomyces purpurogeneiscleroticus]
MSSDMRMPAGVEPELFPEPGIESGTAPVAGGELYYEAAGAGPAVVLLHEGMLDLTVWDEQFGWLARSGYRVVRYDARGHGRSSVVDGDYAHHEDLRALLAHLGIARATLVGHSHGARVALDSALAHPDAVAALVLAAPGISGRAFSDPFLLHHIREQVAAVSAPGGVTLFIEHFLRMWVDGPHREPASVDAGLRERIRATAKATVRAHAEGMGRGTALEVGAAGRLAEISVPTLVMDGDLDSTDISANAHAVALAVPGARRARIPAAGHMVHLENAAQFDRELAEFLRGAAY